jgi:hypothetical protein
LASEIWNFSKIGDTSPKASIFREYIITRLVIETDQYFEGMKLRFKILNKKHDEFKSYGHVSRLINLVLGRKNGPDTIRTVMIQTLAVPSMQVKCVQLWLAVLGVYVLHFFKKIKRLIELDKSRKFSVWTFKFTDTFYICSTT